MSDLIRITSSDLHSPKVDEYVTIQEQAQRAMSGVSDQPWLMRVFYSNWFYLSICSALGGLAGWALLEPFYEDHRPDGSVLVTLLIFPTVGGCIGLFLGAAEGIICRNYQRALKSGAIGFGVGFVGGGIAFIPAAIFFAIMREIAFSLEKNPDEGDTLTGLAFLVLMMGRASAWSLAAAPVGLGQGIALREKKVLINGLVGALLGGLLGGLLFDPISLVLITEDGQATYSRAVGFGAIGALVGLFIGLVEGWTKTAWLLMRKGPLAGKQFILFKDTTVLGSSPEANIYLFKDPAIEPRHALIFNRGGRFEIEDCNTPDGTYVNGVPVTRQVLQAGDQVVLGKTVLEFSVKEAS